MLEDKMAEPTVAEELGRLKTPEIISTDPETEVRRLTQAAKLLNTLAVTDFGGRNGPERQDGMAEQVIAAAFQGFDEEEAHPGTFEKAAVILKGITGGHPFEDGNKRTGFLTVAYFLHQKDIELPEGFSVDEAESLCLRISSGELRDTVEIQKHIEKIWLNKG